MNFYSRDNIQLEQAADSSLSFRARTLANIHTIRKLEEHYEEWRNTLPDDQEEAVCAWASARFRDMHASLRQSQDPPNAEIDKNIALIGAALQSAPALPRFLDRVYRGENHARLTLEQAIDLVREGAIRNEKSFLPTTPTENDAFLFARDYHNSIPVFGENSLPIPLACLAAPIEKQIIYQITLPIEQDWLKAAYLGNSVGEILFQDGLKLRYVDAQMVRYIPEEDFKWLKRGIPEQWDTRLLVTLEPVRPGV